MADAEQIRVEILATAAEFRRELDSAIKKLAGPGGLKDAIKDVPSKVAVDFQMETAGAHTKLGKLRDAIRATQAQIERDSSFGLDTGAARLKLDALERKADQVKRKIAEDAALSAIGGGGRGAAGVLSSVPGSIGPLSPGAVGGVTAAAPFVAAGAGGLTSIAGSAGAGLLGAGALGVGGLGILATGLGSILAVAKPAVEGLTEVAAATEKLQKAQENYGPHSKQAQQAQQNLNTIVKEAPAGTQAAAEGIKQLAEAWEPLAKPAQAVFFKIVGEGLGVLKTLLPTVASIAKSSLQAIDTGLKPVFAGLSSPAFRQVLLELGRAFAKLAPPLIGAFANIFQALANIAVAAAPFVVQVARGFEAMTRSWVIGTSNGHALHGVIGGLVGQFKSWWELAKAVGGLLVALFSAGASEGQSLVNMLTDVLREWTAWMNTKQGQEDLKHFFRDSAALVVKLVEALAPLVAAVAELAIKLMPVATALVVVARELFVTDNIGKGFKATVKALGDALHWLLTSPLALLIPGIGVLIGVIKLWKLATEHAGDAWRAVWHGIQEAFAKVLGTLLGGFSSLLGAIASVFEAADKADFAGIFGDKFSKAAKAIHGGQKAIDDFRNTLAPATTDSKTKTGEIADAHEGASRKIVSSWGNALGATKKGIGEINAEMLAELKMLNGGKVVPLSQGGPPLAPGVEEALTGKKHAGGGYIGHPGERGHDEVPIIVGRGEAVLHAGHQEVVNQALANSGIHGGLGEVFANTGGLHYMMAGGGFAGGGQGALGAMVNKANEIDSRHFPYLWGGGHGSFQGPYDCSGAVSAVLHAGGFLPAPETSGEFESFGQPGQGAVTLYASAGHVYMSLDGKFFGTSGTNPGGGAGWFPGAPRPGFVVRHVDPAGKAGAFGGGAAGGAGQIARVKVKGVGGAVGQVAQGAVDKARNAANATLAKLGGGTPGAGTGKFGGPGQPKELVTASEFGGHNDLSAFGHKTASGLTANDSLMGFAELSEPPGSLNFSALGGLPMGTKIKVGYNGRTVVVPKVDVGAGGPGLDGHVRAIDLTYAAARKLGAPGLENVSWARMARGGFAGAGKTPVKSRRSRPAHHPPPVPKAKSRTVRNPKATAWKAGSTLPADVVKANLGIHDSEIRIEDLGIEYKHLLDAQALVPTEPLVTLSDADVAFMDPGGHVDTKGVFIPGPKGYETGDQIVNAHGMTTGRFFGPSGIAGGKFVAGIDTRLSQIHDLHETLSHQDREEAGEETTDQLMFEREQKAIRIRKAREERMRKFLAKSVARAVKVKQQLEALTTGDLKANLKSALSKQAIGARHADLQQHLTVLRGELAAETHHQSELIPIDKDPSYGKSLKEQIGGVSGAIADEHRLSAATGSSKTVAKAREALLKNTLKGQLAQLTGENRALGGQGEAVGTGGAIGQLAKEVVALREDQGKHVEQTRALPPLRYEIKQQLEALNRETAALAVVSPVQVRTPVTAAEAGPSEKDAQLLALVQQQLAQTQQQLAVSQSQFAVFSGFQPLLAGRLVGKFAHGIDRVPRTGPAIVHEGEVILPDPDGPYGNRAAAQARGGGGPSGPLPEIVIVFGNDERPLMKLIDARMGQKALRVVHDQGGQRSRLIAGVTSR